MTPDRLEALREEIRQLDLRHAKGQLDDHALTQARAELERRIVDQVLQPQAAPPVQRKGLDLINWPWRRLSGLAFVLAGAAVVVAVANERPAHPLAAAAAGLRIGAAPAQAAAAGLTTADAPHALGAEQIQAMTARLSERLAKEPDDADGWAMLARSHANTGQHAPAVAAFRKAAALRPADATLLADFADALAMTQQRRLAGEPLQLVQRALAAEPGNLKALSLAGTEAFDRGDYKAALRFWESLQQAGGADNALVQQVQGGIAEARQLAGLPPTATGASAPPFDAVKVKVSRAPG